MRTELNARVRSQTKLISIHLIDAAIVFATVIGRVETAQRLVRLLKLHALGLYSVWHCRKQGGDKRDDGHAVLERYGQRFAAG